MIIATSVEGSGSLSKEQICANRAKTYTLLYASFRHGEHDALKQHMENNPVVQYFSDSLAYGIRLVENKIRTMSDIAPTLTVLFQYGAKWDSDDLQMPNMKTPYHVICQSAGDHHELLRLMIKEIGSALVNAKDYDELTALTYAVRNANVKCLEILIANGGEVNPIDSTITQRCTCQQHERIITREVNPLVDSMAFLFSDNSCDTMMDIFDLLLDNGANLNNRYFSTRRTPIMFAASFGIVRCVKKLIDRGAQLDLTDISGRTVWSLALAAESGSVDMLKYLLEDNRIDKNSIDKEGLSVLYWAVKSGNIEAVRYLLKIGVRTTTYIPTEYAEPCKHCRKCVQSHYRTKSKVTTDAYMLAISMNQPEVMKLMEDHGCLLYQSDEALSYAVRMNSVETVDYLLHNHKFSLNFEYTEDYDDRLKWNPHQNLLSKTCQQSSWKVVKLLLERGADPNTESCIEKCPSAITAAILKGCVEVVATFIRSGANVNHRSTCSSNVFDITPFEVAVSHSNFYAAEMLLVSGCSRGKYGLEKSLMVKVSITPEQQGFLKKWDVLKNNVVPLEQRCRMVILNHLCPQADKKITELPLPPHIIKYLSIPELDDILETFWNNPLTYKSVLKN